MKINRVTISDRDFFKINYDVVSGGGNTDSFSVKSYDAPAPTFIAAVRLLRRHVIKICEFPDSFLKRILINKVAFSYQRELMNAAIEFDLVLNQTGEKITIKSPRKYCGLSGDDASMTEGMRIDLQNLQEECQKYVYGNRAQMTIFDMVKNPENPGKPENENVEPIFSAQVVSC